MAPDQSAPAPVDQGFPNPLADHYDGERTPEEEFKFRQEQARRQAVGETPQAAPEGPEGDRPPPNPYPTPRSAY